MQKYTPKQILDLNSEHRSVLDDHISFWKEIANISLPMAMRSIEEEGEVTRRVKGGDRRDIYNDTIVDAKEVAVAGFMAGITPSESPWFQTGITLNGRLLTLVDIGPEIKNLIDIRTEVLRSTIYESNFYSSISELYGDGFMFGNGGILMDESDELDGALVFEYTPLGTFVVLENHRGVITGLIRTLQYTTKQIYDKFVVRRDGTEDWTNVSPKIKTCWENLQWYSVHTVMHAILPTYGGAKPYWSYYFEKDQHQDKFLKTGTYSYFPFYFWRWSKRQGEPYAQDCPGMKVFHTNDALQTLEKGMLIGYNQKADPTLKVTPDVDTSMYNRTKHGGIVVVQDTRENAVVEPLFKGLMYPFTEGENKVTRLEERIRKGFYNDMFMAFLNSNRTEKTREEIIKKYEEKLIMLAPVVGRAKDDLLNPILRDASMIQERAGRIPSVSLIRDAIREFSPVAQSTFFNADSTRIMPIYTSLVMQAMRMLGSENLNTFLGTVGALAQVKQAEGSLESPWDLIDTDALTKSEAERHYIPANVLRTTTQVQDIRNARAEGAKRQQEAQLANIEANTTNTLVKAGAEAGAL